MNQKRSRSLNWDDEEKQLFLSVLKDYTHIIENKSLDSNTNKKKTIAWEKLHKKFNELNVRRRQLSQLKIQWKTMKIYARKKFGTYKTEQRKTGGGARPAAPDDAILEIKDLLNPAELLLRDHNSDGIIPSLSADQGTANETPKLSQQGSSCEITLQVPKGKIMSNDITDNGLKSRKDHDDYISSMIIRSKMLKEEHKRRMEMSEEEHAIKMAIQEEKLKSAILEREILEIRKKREEKN